MDEIPDHLLQEMQDFAIKLTLAMKSYIEEVEPNIALSGLNWSQACLIKHLVKNDPEELRKAARMSCSMLLHNMETLIKQMEKEETGNEL